MQMHFYLSCIELFFCFIFPLFPSFSRSPSTLPLSSADWTVSWDSESHWWPLSHCMPLFSHISLTHCFSVWLFSPYFFLSVAHFPISVSLSVPSLSLFHTCPPPSPLNPYSPVPDIPRYYVLASSVSVVVCLRIQAYMWSCFSAFLYIYRYVCCCRYIDSCVSGCVFSAPPADWKSDYDKALLMTWGFAVELQKMLCIFLLCYILHSSCHQILFDRPKSKMSLPPPPLQLTWPNWHGFLKDDISGYIYISI